MSSPFDIILDQIEDTGIGTEQPAAGLEDYIGGTFIVNEEDNSTPKEAKQLGKKVIMSSMENIHSSNPNLPNKLPTHELISNYTFNEDINTAHRNAQVYMCSSNGKQFRLYMCGNTDLCSPFYQNTFMQYLTNLTPEQEVTIEMGSMLGERKHNLLLGSLISSITLCRGKVTTLAASRCGFSESCIWLFGHERIISPYGAIQFTGIKSFMKHFSAYRQYFTTIFDRGKEIGLFDDSIIDILTNTSKTIMFTSDNKYNINE